MPATNSSIALIHPRARVRVTLTVAELNAVQKALGPSPSLTDVEQALVIDAMLAMADVLPSNVVVEQGHALRSPRRGLDTPLGTEAAR